MGTVFELNGRKINTKFGELALCESCKLLGTSNTGDLTCTSAVYPHWDEGWCKQYIVLTRFVMIPVDSAKKMCAEAFDDGAEREREECGAERYREPVLDESRD